MDISEKPKIDFKELEAITKKVISYRPKKEKAEVNDD